jgi:hypothetical protein
MHLSIAKAWQIEKHFITGEIHPAGRLRPPEAEAIFEKMGWSLLDQWMS